jgi:hypothetical protein
MAALDKLQEHLRGEHRAAAKEDCPACQRTRAGHRSGVRTPSPKKPRKAHETTRLCTCGCGGTVSPGSVFLPGHDAKLKRDLLVQAHDGSTAAWMELVIRDWSRLVPLHKRPPAVVLEDAAVRLGERDFRPAEWLAARNAIRTSH